MSVTANLAISLRRSGGDGGQEDINLPTQVATSALDLRFVARLPAGFTTLVGNILTSSVTLTGAKGMLIQPSSEGTATIWWGQAAGSTMAAICQAPYPAFISSGLTLSNVGVSCSAASTLTFVIF